jgi:hypothetical protein
MSTQGSISFNFERVHPVVFILMYWIYLLPSTQQTIGYNGYNQLFVVLTVINKSNTSISFTTAAGARSLPSYPSGAEV